MQKIIGYVNGNPKKIKSRNLSPPDHFLNAVACNSQLASNNGTAAGHKKTAVGKTFETRIVFRGKSLLFFKKRHLFYLVARKK